MSDFDVIREQWADTPQVNAALVVAEAAQELDRQVMRSLEGECIL